ncbi:hypothetical protein [Thiomicrorhabdus sp.]|uniref:hypothetical protein n=1 Tax=Thiomicrorhabdus sp. TaxID=2039724 RepID=UPI00356AA85B
MRGNTQTNKKLVQSDIRTSKFGYTFDVSAEEWQLDNSLKINWKLTETMGLGEDFSRGFRKALAVYASEVSGNYTYNCFNWFKKMLALTGDEIVTVATVQNYLSTLGKDEEYKLGSIKGFLLDWHSKGFEGISDEVADFLEALTLRGNVKGKAVAKGCPHSGAYSMQEQQSILEWAVNAFMDDKITLREYAWLLANMYTGFRPVQLRALAIEDLVVEQLSLGEMEYSLKIPKAKLRGLGFREDHHELDIDEDLALLLFNISQNSIQKIEGALGEP